MAKENLLIIGATGLIGSYITDQIIKAKTSFNRIAIFTSPATAKSKPEALDNLKAQGAEIIIGDINSSSDLSNAFQGINTVVSAVGRPVIASQISWIPLILQSPTVKRFFPSEYGTDVEYGPASAHEIPHQQKLKVRAAVREAEKKGLEYTFVVTGPFAEGYLNKEGPIGGFDVEGKKASLPGDGKGGISLTTNTDVGRLVVKALLHPNESKNRALRVNSFTSTPADIVTEFERQLGGEKWKVEYISLEETRKFEKQAYEDKNPWAAVQTLRRIWAEGGTLYEKRDNGIIDAEDTDTLEGAVRAAIAAQTSSRV